MKNSKKIKQLLDKLSEIEEVVDYLTNGTGHYKQHFHEITNLIEDLALDRKENNIRLAKKLKGLWKLEESNKEDSES